MDKEDMDWKENKPLQTQTVPSEPSKTSEDNSTKQSKGAVTENGIPLGLEALFSACRAIYPDQPNPLQITALVKYWLGGPDPLDYISMYEVSGNPKLNIPSHWHYVSFGLSDIHGDGRVHEFSGPNHPSGFGFELTMRLKREPDDKTPPTWPAAIMQALAKYVFQSESVLCVGDHVSWHSPLDGSESRIQHMLMSPDPTLGCVNTPNGLVQFVQVIGITSEELRAVQHWNGMGVIDIMKRSLVTGGPWLVTDMRRGESMYDCEPSVAEEVEAGIEAQGSNLSGVSARITWSCTEIDGVQNVAAMQCSANTPADDISTEDTEQIRLLLQKGLQLTVNNSLTPPVTDRVKESPSAVDGSTVPAPPDLPQVLPSLHISINLESGALLPLALRGRLKHGRHFTYKSVLGASALTFVSAGVTGTFVNPEAPYCARGGWLQVFIPPELLDKMSSDLSALADPDEVTVPAMFMWPQHKLSIAILPEEGPH